MANPGQHPILETRLRELAARIGSLKEKLAAAKGIARVEELGAIEELERRYAALTDRLQKLETEAPQSRQGAAEELKAMEDDLTGAIDDLITGLDAGAGRAD
jgi:predicted  nucleic acid-binding Zn-ribbon protein